jgi:hypothetical protein
MTFECLELLQIGLVFVLDHCRADSSAQLESAIVVKDDPSIGILPIPRIASAEQKDHGQMSDMSISAGGECEHKRGIRNRAE